MWPENLVWAWIWSWIWLLLYNPLVYRWSVWANLQTGVFTVTNTPTADLYEHHKWISTRVEYASTGPRCIHLVCEMSVSSSLPYIFIHYDILVRILYWREFNVYTKRNQKARQALIFDISFETRYTGCFCNFSHIPPFCPFLVLLLHFNTYFAICTSTFTKCARL